MFQIKKFTTDSIVVRWIEDFLKSFPYSKVPHDMYCNHIDSSVQSVQAWFRFSSYGCAFWQSSKGFITEVELINLEFFKKDDAWGMR